MSQRTPSKRGQRRRTAKAYAQAMYRRSQLDHQEVPTPPLFSDREREALVSGLEEIIRNPEKYRHLHTPVE